MDCPHWPAMSPLLCVTVLVELLSRGHWVLVAPLLHLSLCPIELRLLLGTGFVYGGVPAGVSIW